MKLRSARTSLAIALAFGAACRPEFGDRESLVTQTQILAVRGEPAEVKPGLSATYTLLVATPDGPVVKPLASWAFCATPKLLTENGVASPACLGDGVVAIAEGPPSVAAATPANACSLFGPIVTSVEQRPRDADITGGFYQPVRVTVFGASGDLVAYGLERLDCPLANASADVTTDYAKRHLPNVNPELEPLTIAGPGGAAISPAAVARGATVTLRASWPPASAEPYVVYDPASATLIDHREWMRVSWFATAGTFANDRTGRDETDLATFTENTWTAPTDARTTHLFLVLRDARGGTAYATIDLDTR